MARELDAGETAALLDCAELVDALRTAAVEHADGLIVRPERLVVPLPDGATMLSMPAVAVDVAIHKLITVAPRNRQRGLPTIQGRMTILDPATGTALLTLDGPTVTGKRTAALSMLAIGLLSAQDPRDILLIGTGVQAGHHVDALTAMWPDARIHVRGRGDAGAQRFCDVHRHRRIALDRDDPKFHFDVVITCTTSAIPVWSAAATPETLIVATGSFRPDEAEVAASTVRGSAIVVDDPGGARHEAGDLVSAGVDWDRVMPLAERIRDPGRLSGPVLFKSVGCAAWDLAAARVASRRMAVLANPP